MPAGLPGSTLAQNLANPSAGQAVLIDALSGPKGSPFDVGSAGTASTGAMNTGIGWGLNTGPTINICAGTNPATAAQALRNAGFTDDTGEGAGANSTIIYIGGGRCAAASQGLAAPNPYTAGFLPVGAGNGGSRDGGAGPAFTGFTHKWVTAVADVANGSVVETGYVNRSGVTCLTGSSVLGSAVAAQAAPS